MSYHLQIQAAANIIKNAGIIAYPTESVFGLGCDPLSETAVNRILKLKNRSADKGLIIIAGSIEQLYPYIDISEKEKQIIENTIETTTWLVNKSKKTPHWVSGSHQTVAIRLSSHPLIKILCEKLHHGIISTSANPSGKLPALSLQQSIDYFSHEVDLYLQSDTKLSGKPSQIKDIKTGKLLR